MNSYHELAIFATTNTEIDFTLGPPYNEFGYNEHLAITSNFFPQKKSLLIDINVKKVHLQ